MINDYILLNSLKWDQWVDEKCIWTRPISHEEFIAAKHGRYAIYVTPLKPIPKKWLGEVTGQNILGLASAGGQQCPIFAALGAKVTVFDNSQRQLDTERLVAEREKYSIEIIKGDMSQTFPFNNDSFDFIINPVSNSYINNLSVFWSECYRVLKKGGSLITAFANPDIYMFDALSISDLKVKFKLPLNPMRDFDMNECSDIIDKDGVQFSHTMQEQFGGLIKAGFSINGFYEDKHPPNIQKSFNTYIGAIASKLTKYTAIYYVVKCIKY